MSELPDNETRHLILETAEALFAARGYAAVKLRDIAQAVNMKHASLYYYVPGGKEELFVEVLEHSFRRHAEGIADVIRQAGETLRERLYAVSDWFVTQPAIDLDRIQEGDRPALSETEMQRLAFLAYQSLTDPLVKMFDEAATRREIAFHDHNLMAMTLISVVRSTRNIPGTTPVTRRRLGHKLVDMMLEGWRPR